MPHPMLLALVLALSACSQDPDVFAVEPDLRPAFAAASEQWCAATEGACCPTIDPAGQSTAALVPAAYFGQWTTDDWWGTCTTTVPAGHSIIAVLEDLEGERRLAVVTHEIGHHCGCEHSDDPASIMRAYGGRGRITAADVACASGAR